MIKESEYLKAKKVVDIYNEQLRTTEELRVKKLKAEQLKREEECDDHYYISSGSKWTPIGRMTCINCGQEIE